MSCHVGSGEVLTMVFVLLLLLLLLFPLLLLFAVAAVAAVAAVIVPHCHETTLCNSTAT